MSSPVRRSEFEILLLAALKEISKEVIAWVVLPNHYHCLVCVEALEHVSAALQHLHGTTSRQWNLEDRLTGKRRVWYRFADTYIRNEAHLHLAFNYIHYNPVKHGYVSNPYDWHWSSLPLYHDDKGRDWLREQWKTHTPPPDFGRGWDENPKND